MATILEILENQRDIFALENANLSLAEFEQRWEQETHNLAAFLKAPAPTRYTDTQSSDQHSQYVDQTGHPTGSQDSGDVSSYNTLMQTQQQARSQNAQPPFDQSTDMAPTMSRKRSSHSKFGPIQFSDTEERVPPLALDAWQADVNAPFNGLSSRTVTSPAFKKRRQSLQIPDTPQGIEVYDPSTYCQTQPTLSPTIPLDARPHRPANQFYHASSPYPTSSVTSHSPATSMSDLFPTHTPSTSVCMSREPSLHIDLLRLNSHASDDMHDSLPSNTQFLSNSSQSSDISLLDPSLSMIHVGGVADDASSSPVSNHATCYTSPSTVVHENAMTRSLSSESTESSKSRSSRRSLQEVVLGARHIKPKEDSGASMSRQTSSSSCGGADMTRVRSADGFKVGIPKNNTYVRPQHPKVFCDQCDIKPEGFRGPHELRRHIENKHNTTRTVWVCKDQSPDKKFLSKCKACNEGKKYGAYYNAAAHLRRIHFHAKEKGKKGKGNSKDKPRGGDGGGDDPPMEIIKLWIEASTVSKDTPPIEDDEADDNGERDYKRENIADNYYTYPQPDSTDAATLHQPSFTSNGSSYTVNDNTFSPGFDTDTPFDLNAYISAAPTMPASSGPAAEFNMNASASMITSVNPDLPSNEILNFDFYNPSLFGSSDQFDLNDPSSYPIT